MLDLISIVIHDDEDDNFIYGSIIMNETTASKFNKNLFQERLTEAREIIGYEDGSGDDVVKYVLGHYDEYKDIIYATTVNDLFI